MPKQQIPTQEEIKAEIVKLEALKPNVIRRSGFGDDHHAAIDAQIDVLRFNLPEGQIFDRYEPGDDNDVNRDEGRSDYVLDNAREAGEWMRGENETEAPSIGWQQLAKRNNDK